MSLFLAVESSKASPFVDLGQEDIPGAVLWLRWMTSIAENGPNPQQRQWLTTQTDLLEPQAVSILQRAFDDAESVLDSRGMIIAKNVGDQIKKGSIQKPERIAAVRHKLTDGAATRVYWNVTGVNIESLGDSYGERIPRGEHVWLPSIRTQPGTHLLKVRATVKNVSGAQDPPYALWAFAEKLSAFSGALRRKAGVDGPYRWLDDTIFGLVSSDGSAFTCGFVTLESDLRGDDVVTSEGLTTAPLPVKSGQEVLFAGVFEVPKEALELKLVVLGAPLPSAWSTIPLPKK